MAVAVENDAGDGDQWHGQHVQHRAYTA